MIELRHLATFEVRQSTAVYNFMHKKLRNWSEVSYHVHTHGPMQEFLSLMTVTIVSCSVYRSITTFLVSGVNFITVIIPNMTIHCTYSSLDTTNGIHSIRATLLSKIPYSLLSKIV